MSPPLALTWPKRSAMEAASGTLTLAATPRGVSSNSDGDTAMTVTGPSVLMRLVETGLAAGGPLEEGWLAKVGAPGELVSGSPGRAEELVDTFSGGNGWPA